MADMSDERMAILRMLEENKISATDAVELLNAVANGKKVNPDPQSIDDKPQYDWSTETETEADIADEEPVKSEVVSKGNFRFFRVRVTDTNSGRRKVMVTIPYGLMEWGMKIGSQFSPEVSKINMADFNELLSSGIEGKLVDVMDEESGEHVEVFVE